MSDFYCFNMRGGVKKPKTKKPAKKRNEAEHEPIAVKNKKVNLTVRVKKTARKDKPIEIEPVETTSPIDETTVTAPNIQSPARIISENIESRKDLFMSIGVGFFMILIFIIWIFNMKLQFSQVSNNNQDLGIMENWDEFSKEMEAELSEMQTSLETIEQAGENMDLDLDMASSTASTSPTATTSLFLLPTASTTGATTKDADLELLKQKLKTLETETKQAN